MIGLVDKEKMQTLMSIGASHLNKTKINIKMDMVDEYLKRWADAKYDQYLIFGRKLELVKEIELTMTTDQMDFEVKALCKQYPQYALLLKSFKSSDYIANKFTEFSGSAKNMDEEFVRALYKELYLTKGKKLSLALSEIVQDKGSKVKRTLADGTVVEALHSFDIELSKIMQTKAIKGSVHVSINPNDYLMMSTNHHNWHSCMGIAPSTTGYNNVVLSKMTDESSIVGYKCSNEELDYDINGFKWKHISMHARYLLAIDKLTGTCGIDGGQGGQNRTTELQKSILKILTDQVSLYCDTDNVWVSSNGRNYPTDYLSYNEGIVLSMSHKKTSSKFKRQAYYDIGVRELICPNCGAIMTDRGNFICCAHK